MKNKIAQLVSGEETDSPKLSAKVSSRRNSDPLNLQLSKEIETDKEFIQKAYLKQKTKLFLKVNYI